MQGIFCIIDTYIGHAQKRKGDAVVRRFAAPRRNVTFRRVADT